MSASTKPLAPSRQPPTEHLPKAAAASSAAAPSCTPSQSPCELLSVNADGSVEFSVIVSVDIVRRLKTRAGDSQGLDEYVWLNVFRPALSSHVY